MKGTIGKILVVDDEVELKNILVEALTSQGYEAVGFTTGEEALAALREQAFDVLLTDLMMPGMDGIALVREALQIDPEPDLHHDDRPGHDPDGRRRDEGRARSTMC